MSRTGVVTQAPVMVVMAVEVQAAVMIAMAVEIRAVMSAMATLLEVASRVESFAVAHQSKGNVRSAGENNRIGFSELSRSHHRPPYLIGGGEATTRRCSTEIRRLESPCPLFLIYCDN